MYLSFQMFRKKRSSFPYSIHIPSVGLMFWLSKDNTKYGLFLLPALTGSMKIKSSNWTGTLYQAGINGDYSQSKLFLLCLFTLNYISGKDAGVPDRGLVRKAFKWAKNTTLFADQAFRAIPENKGKQKMEIQFFSVENNSMLRSFGKKLVTL